MESVVHPGNQWALGQWHPDTQRSAADHVGCVALFIHGGMIQGTSLNVLEALLHTCAVAVIALFVQFGLQKPSQRALAKQQNTWLRSPELVLVLSTCCVDLA